MMHELKTVNPFFQEVWELKKPFEVRKNDRNFKRGDEVVLKEYDTKSDTYSGREVQAYISYVLYSYEFEGLAKGYCVFGLTRIGRFENNKSV